MRTAGELIAELSAFAFDTPVLLTVACDGPITATCDIESVTHEDDHSDGTMFVRVYGDAEADTPDPWHSDLSAVPRDRDFLIKFDHGEVSIGHYLDNSRTRHPFKGVVPCRSMRPWRLGEKIVSWMELPR